MKSILYIKRNLQLINEEKKRREFLRFLQNKNNRLLRKEIEETELANLLNENLKNIIKDKSMFLSQDNYEKLYEFAALLYNKWNKKVLRVKFIGKMDYESEIINAFIEWSEHTGIEFQYTENIGDSDIRISLESNSGHWSFIERQAEHTSLEDKATVNFDPIDFMVLDSKSRYGIILHEIGHSLGLLHEHQKENSPIDWNREKVYEDCLSWYNWDRDMVDHNIFNSYNSNDLFYSKEFDSSSIMIYAIPKGWSSNYLINEVNTSLSSTDKKFAKAYYSKFE